ncbi:hypothetical protein AQUCO_05100078v1 [Aquilegia coerulea]|uniref:Knottin scorpion toxin-like domain-containing protein n=1 Tax=Aquilegia coerulea TaxID=218851 RepID=A0A2G5CJ39_AQUCA|nr:hypothetical protein AQUCO_05100078v1 [Aquilegia coerulea]
MLKTILVAIVVTMILASSGNAAPVCQGKCEDIPDCNNFCKNVAGYHGGRCEPPLYQFCCCY